MSNIVYSNVPPMMEAIRNGDIDKLKSLLHAGYSPNELQHYQVNFDDWPKPPHWNWLCWKNGWTWCSC